MGCLAPEKKETPDPLRNTLPYSRKTQRSKPQESLLGEEEGLLWH